MYNLLVQFQPWNGGNDSIDIKRLFEYTDKILIDRFMGEDSILLEKLIELPCLFMREGRKDELARLGTISEAKVSGHHVLIQYSYDADVSPVSNKLIFANKHQFGINKDFEFCRTHWAVKDIDLARTLLRLRQPIRQSPKVFFIPTIKEVNSNLVSVMMPFKREFDDVYKALQDVSQSAGFECRRADEFWENPSVIQDIVALIDRAFVVICDCTSRNPNVFYEMGIGHALNCEVILITQNDEDIPFDISHLRYIKYLNNNEGLQKLKEELLGRLSSIRENL